MSAMHYRMLPHGGQKISVIGLGAGSIHHGSQDQIERTVEHAIELGINYFDICPSEFSPLPAYGRAFRGSRSDILTQMHFGAVYDQGESRSYGWTLDTKRIKRQFEEELETLGTDYTDFGFVHCIDEPADFDRIMNNGTWDYLKQLKAAGTVRHLGASTHSVEIARRFLATGLVDMMMFSINPMYDYTDESQYGRGSTVDRAELYRACDAAGVGLSVMKAFAGGQLLDARMSPFGQALTPAQLVAYALERPAVLTVLPGVRDAADVDAAVSVLDVGPEQRDYSVLGSLHLKDAQGTCVYCNHCEPCPQGIDVGLVNKYYDLARAGDTLARSHYAHLSKNASDCIACGHCESRCPFQVPQEGRMREIAAYFA